MHTNLIKYFIIFFMITLPFYSFISCSKNPISVINIYSDSYNNSKTLSSYSSQTSTTNNTKPVDNNTDQCHLDVTPKYVGSSKSNKYHLPSCEWAQKIKKSNEICFSSQEEAIEKGYLPCKVCKPVE